MRALSRILRLCIGCLLAAGTLGLPASAAEIVAVQPLDLVGRDAALLCEIQHPQATWEEFRQNELFRRLEKFAPYQQLLQSDGFRHWQQVERAVTEATGSSLSSQLLELCSQELVLAAYLSDDHQPEGVFISRADSAEAVEKFLQTWQKLEPQVRPQTLKHKGQAYSLRAASGARHSNHYYVSFGSIFVLSDHESRIKQAIELAQSDAARLNQSPDFRKASRKSNEPPAAVRFALLARKWDPIWQEAARNDEGAALLARLWPAIDAATMDIRPESGLHVEARMHLNGERTDDRWKAWSASLPNSQEFLSTVPQSAVLVAAGGLHFAPLWHFVRELASESDRDEWKKGQRLARGVLGGRDVLEDVLPALTEQAGLYVVPAERDAKFPWDGVLRIQFPAKEQTSGLHLALDQAFATGLNVLSVHVAEKHPETDPAIVRSELSDRQIVRWLETPLPVRIAYRLTPTELTVSRSVETLRRHPASESAASAKTALADARETWFPDAGQFVVIDVRGVRRQRSSTAALLARPNGGEEKLAALLELCDVAYAATKFDATQVTIHVGAGIASDR